MSVIAIKVDGTDITDDVLIRDASFTSLVNGTLGQATFRVKDVDQTYDFNTGDSLTLDVDGVRVWGGYVMQAKKIYALSVIDTDQPAEVTRMWRVMGLDYNVLFQRRIVFKASDPTGKLSFEYSVDTYDDTIIDDIFDNYLTLSGDGLTRAGVTRIAKAILDIPGHAPKGLIASASFTWKQMMDSVARATGGVYYISPDKDLTYVDAETTTSSYTLTDTPSGGFDVGYQSFTIMNDGVNLVNDMLFWSAGGGSTSYVFSRVQDSSSIAEHGRWQLGLVTSGIYRQTSADIVANSYVYGTPQSHRGGKDNALAFNARVFQPVFKAGDIVDIECGSFGFTDTLPLRSMTTTFASPTEPIFDLILTHNIDLAIGLYDQIRIVIPDIDFDIDVPPPIGDEVEGGCVCGITDTFTRTVVAGWGTSDSGVVWTTRNGTPTVDGSIGRLPAGAAQCRVSFGPFPYTRALPMDVAFKVRFSGYTSTSDYMYLRIGAINAYLFLRPFDGVVEIGSLAVTNTYAGLGNWTWFRVNLDSTGLILNAKWWADGDPEPGNWMATRNGLNSTEVNSQVTFDTNGGVSTFLVEIDDVSITENGTLLSRCTAVQFDDFNRTVASGNWGSATPSGLTWTPFNNTTLLSVNGTSGRYALPSSGSNSANAYISALSSAVVPWNQTGGFSMRSMFTPSVVPTGTDRLRITYMVINTTTGGQYWVIAQVGTGGQGYITAETATTGVPHDVSYVWSAAAYNVRWDFVPGSYSRFRIWLATVSEPSVWDIDIDDTGGVPLAGADTQWNMGFTGQGAAGRNILVDYIDFDYDGRPCYLDCSDPSFTGFDDLNRTVSPGWGTASPSGAVYSYVGGTTPWSVNGTQGVLSWPSGSPNIFFGPSGGGSSTDPGPWTHPVWQFQCKYRTGDWAYDGSDGGGYADLHFQTNARTIFLGSGTNIGFPDPHGYIENDDGGHISFDWLPLTWYQVKWYYNWNTGDSWVKVWLDGDTEPDWMVTNSTYNGEGGDSQVRWFKIMGSTQTGSIWDSGNPYVAQFDDLAFALCAPVPPGLATSGTPSSGRVCETITHTGGTDFHTSQAFYSGTLNEVYINGIQEIGTRVTSNGGADAAFFLDPGIDATDELYVCYNANGAPIV